MTLALCTLVVANTDKELNRDVHITTCSIWHEYAVLRKVEKNITTTNTLSLSGELGSSKMQLNETHYLWFHFDITYIRQLKKDSYARKVYCPIAVNAWSSTQKLETTCTEYKQYARFYDSILHELQIYPEQPV